MSIESRLIKNNQDLEALKTDIENLPDYQNLEYLYSTASLYNMPFNFNNVTNPFISRWNKYFLFSKGSNTATINILENNEVTELFSFTTPSSNCYKLVSGNLDRNILYIVGERTDSYLGLFRLNLENHNFDLIYEFTQRFDRNTNYSEYAITIDDTNFIICFSGQHCKLVNLDTTNDSVTLGDNQKDNAYSYRCYYQTSYNSYYSYNYSDYTGNKDVALIKVNNNSGIISTIKYQNSSPIIRGHNYFMTKIFLTDGIYELTDTMTIGNKLSEYSSNELKALFPISADLYAQYDIETGLGSIMRRRTSRIYKFNEDTNEFTLYDEHFMPFIITSADILGCDITNQGIVQQIASNIKKAFKLNGKLYSIDDKSVADENILSGYEAFDNTYTKLVGTMPNNGQLTITPSTVAQTIPAGYTSGGTVSAVDNTIDSNILAENIKAGVTILGVTGTYTGEEIE